MMARRLDLTVPRECAGVRVDTLLRKQLGLSGTVIRRIKWMDDGILVDGVRVNTRFVPRPGQVLSVRLSEPERRSGIVGVCGQMDVVYEDEDIIVVNKPAGLSVHPGPGHWEDTLGNLLVGYYQRTGQEADFHPVHRLDRGTSGLLVCAKHPHAQEILKQQLHTSAFGRVYLAVCEGEPRPPEGVVDAPLGAKEGSLVEQCVRPDGKSARTRYETLAAAGGRALLRVRLDTGRTHQIRVHMAYMGHPLVGDFLYGTQPPELMGRTALHSHRLTLRHPVTGRDMEWVSPLPEDMRQLFEGEIFDVY